MHFGEGDSLQKQLDDIAKVAVEGAAANQAIINGNSTNPSLYAGANIKIQGFDHRDYGSYIITSVNHRYNIGGDYHNTFTAIPADVKASPYTNPALTPTCESQAGVVTDNNDPNSLGRVKVRLYWQNGTETPWLRIVMPYTGSDKGIYFVPEKGEEVMVGFEGGNAEMPYIIGSLYHGNMNPGGLSNSNNDIKAIKTRSGHLIEFKDTDGEESITMTDKKGNVIKIDSAGDEITITALKKITISAQEEIKLSAKNITIDANESLSIGANKNISQSAGEKFNLMAKNMEEHIEEKKVATSKKSEITGEEVTINSTDKNLTLASGKSVDVQSNEKVKLF
jgi:uncharacterized protein involved in type VI secretion and phage assembly